MKIKKKYFTRILLLFIFLLLISCSKSNNNKIEILSYKDNHISYQVFEQLSKVSSDDIDQCENFLEYNNSANGFEIYGASIADVYSNLYDVDRNKIKLKDKKAIFYSIIYKGPKNTEIIKDMVEKLLNKRNLNVLTASEVMTVYVLSPTADQILNEFVNPNESDPSSVTFLNNEIQLKNGTLSMLIRSLNEHYTNSFVYNENSSKKFDLKIPMTTSIDETIDYMHNKYGITFTKENQTMERYIISHKSN